MTKLERDDLASFIDEAIDSPVDRDGIVQDLLDYVDSMLGDLEKELDKEFIRGAKAALWGKSRAGGEDAG